MIISKGIVFAATLAFAVGVLNAGMYYTVDGSGSVTRHDHAETPYPVGAIIDPSGAHYATPEDQLCVSNGVLRLRSVDDFNARQTNRAPMDVSVGFGMIRTYADGSIEMASGPIIVPGTTNGAYEIWVDSETGLVLTTLDHASPRKSKAEKDAAKSAKLAKVAAVKAAQSDKEKLDALYDLLGLK